MTSRSSNFELMRLMLMIFIMMHHFITALPSVAFSTELHIADIFFHTAVIDFVILSGYFGIKFKISGFLKLIIQIIFYSLVLTIACLLFFKNCSWIDIVKSFMPLTNGYYWFVAVYLQLYLLAPFLNLLLEKLDNKSYLSLLIILAFLIFYAGLIRNGNICIDGKNIVNFIFIYTIGGGIRRAEYYIRISKNDIRKLSCSAIALILLVVLIADLFMPDSSRQILARLTYLYHSPGLILLSIAIFALFRTISFQNKVINRLAISSFAIYLFHEHPHMKTILYKDFFSSNFFIGSQPGEILLYCLVYAICLGTCAILFDSIRLRLFYFINPLFIKADKFTLLSKLEKL